MKKVSIIILVFFIIFSEYITFADTPSQNTLYSIQVGYYKDNNLAQTLLKNIKKQGFPAYKVTKKGTHYIFVGDFRSYEKAQNAKIKLENSGLNAQLYTKSPKTKEFQKLPTENSKKTKSNPNTKSKSRPKPKQKPKSKPSKPKTTSTISSNTKPQTSENDIINVDKTSKNLKKPKEELAKRNNKTLIAFLIISSAILFLGVKSVLT